MLAAPSQHLLEHDDAQRSGVAQFQSPNITASEESMYIFNAYNESSDMQKVAADFILADNSKDALFFLRQYTLPVIGLFGIIGNVLSASIFLGSKHRNTSCSLYLAARSIADTGFIVTLFIAWLDFVDVRIFHVEGVCQITVFVSYVSSFMSVSFVVCITFENYIRICKPMKVNTFCTTKVAKRMIGFLFVMGIVGYNFPLWATRVRMFHGKHYCLTLPQYRTFEVGLTYADTILTLMIPFIIIITLLFLIICAAMEASKRQLRLRRLQSTERTRSSNNPQDVVKRLLTSVSVAFLVLQTPSHVIRIKVIIEHIIGEYYTTTQTDRRLQYVFLTMYYLNFSINFVLYLVCCKTFRKEFVSTLALGCKCCMRRALVQRNNNEVYREETEQLSNGMTMAEIINEKDSSEHAPFHNPGSAGHCDGTCCSN
ncbi:P2Y purinoceptor 14-like [Mizuhopecten yessoensis]|uniref:Neuropeptides capa receptor n=1 Tax=Mizuhopecten yessoensis TaxID=6573 RepID=A0A210PY68_MIZYE|nr:P2Y purinoceptor 14-like [Mizuhopecten yessoensis]OWF41425.1 Neuropeptides capa receptor [Mizuhopecten yessoensis]